MDQVHVNFRLTLRTCSNPWPTGSDMYIRLDGSTHLCRISQCGGGVGRNIAEALWRLRGGRTHLLTAIGNDSDAKYLQDITPGLFLDGCVIEESRTASYAAVFDKKGECLLGLGDMEVHTHISIDLVNKHMEKIKNAPLVVLDGNIPQSTTDYVIDLCSQLKKPIFFEPTDRRKATKALGGTHLITYSSPNIAELRAMAKFLEPNHLIKPEGDLEEIMALYKLIKYINVLIVTMGKKGVITVKQTTQNSEPNIQIYSPDLISNIENVSGAGDCFASGFIYGVLQGLPESECVSIGFKSAKAALLSKNNVPPSFDI